jgi:hypothetical protein
LARIPTTGAMNTFASGVTSETRYLVVTWTSMGVTQTAQINYRVVPFFPVRIQPADVRTVIGANQEELADSEIDIFAAILYVAEDITPAVFNAAVTAGDITTVRVNQLVALWAALDLAPSVQLRIAASQKNELAEFTRYRGLDTAVWRDDTLEAYNRTRDDLLQNSNSPAPIFVLTPGVSIPQFLPDCYIWWPMSPPQFPDIYGDFIGS